MRFFSKQFFYYNWFTVKSFQYTVECQNLNVRNPNYAEIRMINRSNRSSSDFGHSGRSNDNFVRILAFIV